MDRMGFYNLLRTRSDTFRFPALRPRLWRGGFGKTVIDSLQP